MCSIEMITIFQVQNEDVLSLTLLLGESAKLFVKQIVHAITKTDYRRLHKS